MVEMIVYFDCVLCIIDLVLLSSVRRFLFDFLIEEKSRKSAKRIHLQQSINNRITLAYILPLLKHNVTIYKRYQTLYKVMLATLMPQYAILLIFNIIRPLESLYLCAIFVLLKIVISLVVRSQTDSNLVSRYRRK